MNRWIFTIIFIPLGAFLSWFGYMLLQGMDFFGAILILPTIPIIKLLNWDSALGFYHSGGSADNLGIIKVVLIETIEFGLMGWCLDLIRHRKVKSRE